MPRENVARLATAYFRARDARQLAFNGWDKANDHLRDVLTEMRSLFEAGLTPELEERERRRLDASLRVAENFEASARLHLASADENEHHAAETMRWASDRMLQTSTKTATWVMALIAAAALAVSAWSASRPPSPVRIELKQTATPPGSTPGPWRLKIVDQKE